MAAMAGDRGSKQHKSMSLDTKYFHEAGNTLELCHYDARYFKGEVAYEEHHQTLRHLIRSYLTMTRNLGVETWLTHGTLLGWRWNWRILPWDYDLDMQVAMTTLKHMARNLNGALHEYSYFDDAKGETRICTGQLQKMRYLSLV